MAERIRIVQGSALEAGPATGGMTRNTAFGSDNVWVGEVRTRPQTTSGWHHHGDHTTYGYVIAGRLRFDFPDGSGSVEAGPGDFFMVPPQTVHREGNPASEEQVLAAIRVGTGPTVINVEGPSGA